jgi:hypothetical protein
MDSPLYINLLGRSGSKNYDIDISRDACDRFGLYHNDILVHVSTGLKVKVIGVYNNLLFCKCDKDAGVSFWDDVQCYDDFISKGYIKENKEIINNISTNVHEEINDNNINELTNKEIKIHLEI